MTDLRAKWLNKWRSMPLVQRLDQQTRGSGGVWGIRHAWQALAVQQATALSTGAGFLPLDSDIEGAREAIANEVLDARCTVWREDDLNAALDADLPAHVFSADDLAPTFWVFTRMPLLGARAAALSCLVRSRATHIDFLINWIDDKDPDGDGRLSLLSAVRGMRWPLDIDAENRPLMGTLLRLYWYAATADEDGQQIGNPTRDRKKLRRAGYRGPHTVNVVGRRAVRESADSGARMTARHWVRGHFKEQWFPSEEVHRVKWIDPYLRGPRDAEIVPTRSLGTVRKVAA